MLYGNVGAVDRLDFTVIGPAVNEVARIETLCEPLGRNVLVSAEFAAARGEPAGASSRSAATRCAACASRARSTGSSRAPKYPFAPIVARAGFSMFLRHLAQSAMRNAAKCIKSEQ